MEKLKALLKELGASDELSNALIEQVRRYSVEVREHYDRLYADKLEKAKGVCLEEVEKEKVGLAKKVATYLEAKASSIEQAHQRQLKNEEAEATSLLKRVKAVLEGIDLEKGGDSRQIQTLNTQVGRLQRQMTSLREERDEAVMRANRANDIAERSLSKNRVLEQKLRETEPPVSEAACPKCGKEGKEFGNGRGRCPEHGFYSAKAKEEGDTPAAGAPPAGDKPAQPQAEGKLGKDRVVSERPRTTRPALSESAARPRRRAGKSDEEIAKIASAID